MVVVPLFPSFLTSLCSPSSSLLGTGCLWNERSGLRRGLAWIRRHQKGLSSLQLISVALRWHLQGPKRRTCFIRMIKAYGGGPELWEDRSRGFKVTNHKQSSALLEQIFWGKKRFFSHLSESGAICFLLEWNLNYSWTFVFWYDPDGWISCKSSQIKPRVTTNKCSFDIAVGKQDHQTSKAKPFVLTDTLIILSESVSHMTPPPKSDCLQQRQ